MTFRIIQGDNRLTLKTLANNSIDAIVTDPPYGIDFLGKSWDANTGALETYQECLRVLKPGGHILAFSAARTYHHLAVTLEQAGFEIRDQIMWIYSSGFPKSQDVGRQLHKKAHGKPDKQRFDPSIMIKEKNPNPNVRDTKGDSLYKSGHQKNDTGHYRHPETGKVYRALPDINGDRLAVSHEGEKYGTVYEEVIVVDNEWSGWGTALKPAHEPIALARKPINEKNIAKNCQQWGTGAINIDATRVKREGEEDRFPSNVLGELQEDYQKYFYCPKVSRRERHVGFEDPGPRHPGADGGGYQVHNVNDELITKKDKKKKHDPLAHIPTNPNGMWDDGVQYQNQQAFSGATEKGNNHPTVKPVELMKYLIKLITPPGGTVLDPFNGSGSTGCAAVELGFDYIGCELDPAYVTIAETRIRAWQNKDCATNNYGDLFEE
jgi:DNA modification methylase